MKKDEVWERLKRDDSLVYGEPIMDMFLKATNDLERRHWDSLPVSKRNLVSAQCMLDIAETPEEADAAIKKGAVEFRTAMRKAAQRDDRRMIEFLLGKGYSDTAYSDMQSIITVAAVHGSIESFKALGAAGVVPGDMAVGQAAYKGHMNIIRHMAENMPKVNINYGLVSAAEGGQVEVIDYLLSKGAKGINHALERAAGRGVINAMELLISKGATNLDDALFVAIRSAEWAAVDMLLAKDADPSEAVKWAAGHRYYLLLNKMTERKECLEAAEKLAEKSHPVAEYLQWRKDLQEGPP